MSFILDALKKLERQKQTEGAHDQESPAVMQGGRRWGEERRRGFFGWGSVLVALAALIVAAVALYRSRELPSPTETMSEPPTSTTPKTESSTTASKDPTDAQGGPVSAEVKKAESTPTTTVLASHEPKAPTRSEVVEDPDPAPPESSEPAHPVRLLGRNAKERAVSRASDDEVGAPSSEIPEGLPELVLQGTSVVEGKPVAVVNYQRLFEGDFIEGARVIRISDSLVELEFKGKRFKISF